ncbi:MAG: hypothetical protein Q9222_001175 [Ikaeria aurantiellina]
MSQTSIYAELLLNIRQTSVVASLPTESNEKTSVTLSKDKTSISVCHEGQSATIKLPASVRAGGRLAITTPAKGIRDLAFRLPAADAQVDALRSNDNTHFPASTWPASSMTPDTEFACRFCSVRIVNESVKTWKDLPSENWAEMMDFWHCHKPDPESDDKSTLQNGAKKGYGTGSSIEPTAAVGLVDTTYLLLMRQDCNVSLQAKSLELSIWIFIPNMYFSSTLLPQSPKQAMKLYYKPQPNPTALLEQQSSKIDELQLPDNVINTLHSDLRTSTQLLPAPARKFQDWHVGLLER